MTLKGFVLLNTLLASRRSGVHTCVLHHWHRQVHTGGGDHAHLAPLDDISWDVHHALQYRATEKYSCFYGHARMVQTVAVCDGPRQTGAKHVRTIAYYGFQEVSLHINCRTATAQLPHRGMHAHNTPARNSALPTPLGGTPDPTGPFTTASQVAACHEVNSLHPSLAHPWYWLGSAGACEMSLRGVLTSGWMLRGHLPIHEVLHLRQDALFRGAPNVLVHFGRVQCHLQAMAWCSRP